MQIRLIKTPLYYIVVGIILAFLIGSELVRIGATGTIWLMAGLATAAVVYSIWGR